jgi:hypothetical protein
MIKVNEKDREQELEIIERIGLRLAKEVYLAAERKYNLWELPIDGKPVIKRVDKLTNDERKYVLKQLHYFILAAFNRVAILTDTEIRTTLDNFRTSEALQHAWAIFSRDTEPETVAVRAPRTAAQLRREKAQA